MKLFGLIGYPLSHSFSARYFTEKFGQLGLHDHEYRLFPLEHIDGLVPLVNEHPELCGLNVTIPYKEQVIPLLDAMDEAATEIGAVNVIRIDRGMAGKQPGYRLLGSNTDAWAFRESLRPVLRNNHQKALILGTGGSAKAVAWVLRQLHIEYLFVSRTNGDVRYEDLNAAAVKHFPFIINCTPAGMYPNADQCPGIPYEHLDSTNFLYDLVYNPEESLFLKKGRSAGALTLNGLPMLKIQAERSWELFREEYGN